MEPIEIRSARPSDADAVEEYHHRCFVDTYAAQLAAGEFLAPDREGTRQQLLGWFQPECEFQTWVAVIDDRPIGHFMVYRHHLIHLFVAPEHQGTGFGRHLLTQAEATLVAAGHNDLELHTRVENLSAIAFYKQAGWVLTDKLITTVEHGINYNEHIMTK